LFLGPLLGPLLFLGPPLLGPLLFLGPLLDPLLGLAPKLLLLLSFDLSFAFDLLLSKFGAVWPSLDEATELL
jgi:hypothetical protein